MRLSELLEALGRVPRLLGGSVADPEVHRVVQDSRLAAPGDLFCCVPGSRADGHRYAAEAVEAGAVAVVAERGLDLDVPVAVVESTRRAMPLLAASVSGHPSRRLEVVGVTGTNGKTSVVHLLAGILRGVGRRTETIGTLSGELTTPEAPTLQRRLAGWADEGCEAVAMEVSSHALEQGRVDATRFAAVGFTNLSRDHLDHHGSMEAYGAAKARLFTTGFADRAVIAVDTPFGRDLAARAAGEGLVVVEVSPSEIDSEVHLDHVAYSWRGIDLSVPVGGTFSVANSLVAAELAVFLGAEPARVAEGLASATPVPGRFELLDAGGGVRVVVDYAHSPDALGVALSSLRSAADGRVIVVFGCGGERDAGKRPLMGRAAEAGADLVVVTSDNPRGEPPAGIAEDILSGMERAPQVVELDRRRAIRAALELAEPGDVVLVAGRGHERVQALAGGELPFLDRSVVLEEAAVHAGPSAGGSGGVGA